MTDREEMHELRLRLQGCMSDLDSAARELVSLRGTITQMEQVLESRDARIRTLEDAEARRLQLVG